MRHGYLLFYGHLRQRLCLFVTLHRRPELSEKMPRKPGFYILHGVWVGGKVVAPFFSLGMPGFGFIRVSGKGNRER